MTLFDKGGEKTKTESGGSETQSTTHQGPSVLSANQKSASQLTFQSGGNASDEQVLVLEASTSTTKLGSSMTHFDPRSAYSAVLSQDFFNQIASPTGHDFKDMLKPTGAAHGDVLSVNGKPLGHKQAKGKATSSSTMFEITSVKGASPDARQATNNVQLEASGNGMLILARLASAYASAVQSGAVKDPAKLRIFCHVTMDTDAQAKDGQSRKETYLTTEPHSFGPTWNGLANGLMSGLIGAYGFKQDVMPNYLGFGRFNAVTEDSVRAFAKATQETCEGSWMDQPFNRTFVTSKLTGIGDAVLACAGARAPKAFAAMADDQDTAASAVAGEAFGTKSPAEWSGVYNNPDVRKELIRQNRQDTIPAPKIDAGVRTMIVDDAKSIAQMVLGQLLELVPAGIAKELPPELARYAPLMAQRWNDAVKAGLASVNWNTWYDLHFQVPKWSKTADPPASLSTGTVNNAEGFVNNPNALTKIKTPPVEVAPTESTPK